MWHEIISVCVVCADLPGLLRDLFERGVSVRELQAVDDLTLNFVIEKRNAKALLQIAGKHGAKVTFKHHLGVFTVCKALLARPVAVLGIALLLLISLYLPTKILFVRVEGNSQLSEQRILQAAEEFGICFGANRRQVRSEQVKNKLLNAIPELQWVGVNTYGCTAVISVREKCEPALEEKTDRVSGIVSAADGVILSCTVRKGTALCQVGDAVKAGELLVSGYTDCGLKVQADVADAEIMAQTIHMLDVRTPDRYLQRGVSTGLKRKFSLQIGKKRINFYIDSGISDSTCVKMYSRQDLTLPGGFQLPISLIITEYHYFTTSDAIVSNGNAETLLKSFSAGYLRSQMISGQIIQEESIILHLEDHYLLTGEFACTEMIGRTTVEEKLYTDGKEH